MNHHHIDHVTHAPFDEAAYQAQIKALFDLRRGLEARGLEGMQALWDALGRPAEGIPCVQVAGTNGKGSVCAWLSSLFYASGARVGLFTSPHLVHVRERFRIDERDVSDVIIAHWLPRVLQAAYNTGYPPLFFEVITALGLCLFAEAKVDWIVLEVGLGGRLDATTVFPAVASVITSIGLDHCAWLGDTFSAIAREKAGIFRAGVPAWIGHVPQEAAKVIQEEARLRQVSALHWAETEFALHTSSIRNKRANADPSVGAETGLALPSSPTPTQSEDALFRFVGDGESIDGLRVPLYGEHQHHNLALALAVALGQRKQGLQITETSLRQGVQHVRWDGRLQRIIWRERVIWLDGAHNPEAAHVLAKALASIRPAVLIFGAMQDKDAYATLSPLLGCVRHVIFCAAQTPRAWSGTALQQIARTIEHAPPCEVAEDLADALNKAHAQTHKSEEIVLAGSLYLVGEALHLLDISRLNHPSTSQVA